MNYKYIKGDIFKRKNCYYAHCISRDYALGAGIAVEFSLTGKKSPTSIGGAMNCLIFF